MVKQAAICTGKTGEREENHKESHIGHGWPSHTSEALVHVVRYYSGRGGVQRS